MKPTDGLPLLVARRSMRIAGLNLLTASLGFGFSVAFVWYAWREGADLIGPLFLLVLIAVYGVQAGQNFRDDRPKVVVERAGLSLPAVTDAPIPWGEIEQVALGKGIRTLGGGRLDVVVSPQVFARLKLGQRWLGDPIVKRGGISPAFTVLGSALDTDMKTLFTAIRRHWPPGDGPPA